MKTMKRRCGTLFTLLACAFAGFGQTKLDLSTQVKLTDSIGIGDPCPSGTPAGSLCVSKNLVLRSAAPSHWGLIPGMAPAQAEESKDLSGGYYPTTFWVRDPDGVPCVTVWSSKTVGGHYCGEGKRRIASVVFDGRGTALSRTEDSCTLVPGPATISGVTLLADVNGSATIDVRTVAAANYTGASSATTITGSAVPQLGGQAKYQDTVLNGWNTAVTTNTVVCFHLSNPAGVTWVAALVEGR